MFRSLVLEVLRAASSRGHVCTHLELGQSHSTPCAKIMTRPGSRIMSSAMCWFSQAITTTACLPTVIHTGDVTSWTGMRLVTLCHEPGMTSHHVFRMTLRHEPGITLRSRNDVTSRTWNAFGDVVLVLAAVELARL